MQRSRPPGGWGSAKEETGNVACSVAKVYTTFSPRLGEKVWARLVC